MTNRVDRFITRTSKEIEQQKIIAAEGKSKSSRTRAINTVNRKLKMIKSFKKHGHVSNYPFFDLSDEERFSPERPT